MCVYGQTKKLPRAQRMSDAAKKEEKKCREREELAADGEIERWLLLRQSDHVLSQ